MNQKIPWCANPHAVNFCPQHDAEIPGIQGQKRVALRRERGDEHWFVFGGRQEQGALRGEGIRNPLDEGLQVLPMCGSLRCKLGEFFLTAWQKQERQSFPF